MMCAGQIHDGRGPRSDYLASSMYYIYGYPYTLSSDSAVKDPEDC